jgi:hypothetical protein
MPAVPASIIEPIWDQFEALIPEVVDSHPLGCHRPRVDHRVVFDKLVESLKWGISYEGVADASCSATTVRRPAETSGFRPGSSKTSRTCA